MVTWRPIPKLGEDVVGAIVALAVFGSLAALFLGVAAVSTVSALLTDPGASAIQAVGSFVVVLAVLGLIMSVVWRLLHLGVDVSESGLRVRSHWRTRIVPWEAVAEIESRQTTDGTGRQAIWIVCTSTPAVETPLHCNDDTWARATLVSLGRTKAGGKLLNRDVYTATLTELRALLRQRVGDPPMP